MPFPLSKLPAKQFLVLFCTVSLYNYKASFGTSNVLLFYLLHCLSFGDHYVVRFCVFKFHCCLFCSKLSSLNEEYCVLNIARK